jgi:hypothetical protein
LRGLRTVHGRTRHLPFRGLQAGQRLPVRGDDIAGSRPRDHGLAENATDDDAAVVDDGRRGRRLAACNELRETVSAENSVIA